MNLTLQDISVKNNIHTVDGIFYLFPYKNTYLQR